MSNNLPAFRLSDPIHLLAVGFGSGLAPKAPGTFGTLAAIPIFLIMAPFATKYYAAVVAIMAIFGIYICGKTATDVGVHDHPAIVWDEFVGFVITMFMIPPSLVTIAVGFALFRFFDIVKPWPISLLDKNCQGGAGIMIDDIVAGFMALGCMHLIF